jgi:hypothetical protein
MTLEDDLECCFHGCLESESKPDLRIEVSALDEGCSVFRAHEKCFNARKDPSVMPDKPEFHGSLPKDTACVFCGSKMPVFGKHPYCFDVGDFSPPHRYWAHNQCMRASLKDEKKFNLPF